ncbi:MBL fold metallo-hydrolase [uncultured Parabacteroides sp.]|uniref:ComEC/Rec2 family competence protein n=1 Tax=uncultured Parabacteroides sp. TaxID=512312 RepID=UPI0025D5FBDA|nr:MBL fold metallo-hydrolase [uncultured Parabacteroides sp.]
MVEIIIWDVQHGSASYIKSPNGRHIIVDAGLGSYENSDKAFSPLYHLWKNYGVKQIDYAILTHPHKDHIEDINNLIELTPKVLRRPKHLTRDDIISPQTAKMDIPLYEKYIEFSNKYTSNVSGTMNDPTKPENYGGLKIQTFSTVNCATCNLNNQSIISVFSYANSKIVIAGDNESPSYNELFEDISFKNAIKDADILVASHHGRASGYHDEFVKLVKLVKPKLTIISDSSKKETSVVTDYGMISSGWTVFSRTDGSSMKRSTLSTYNDGHIVIKMGYNSENKPFLNIKKK